MGPDRRQLLTFQDINYLDLCLWYEEWQCTFEMFSNELESRREGRWTVNFEHRNNEPGGLGSQGANQVFQRFNSFVPGLIGCLTRLGGFLWPQLETSVKRLDEHSESVKCFNNQLAVSLFKTRLQLDYLSSRSFHRELYSRPLVCMPVFVAGAGCSSGGPPPPDINSPVFTPDRIQPGSLPRRQQPAQAGQGLGRAWVTRICISSASVWPPLDGLHKTSFYACSLFPELISEYQLIFQSFRRI